MLSYSKKSVYKNLEFQVGGSYLKEHLMFNWYMTEKFSLKVLKIAVLIYGFLLYAMEDPHLVLKKSKDLYKNDENAT